MTYYTIAFAKPMAVFADGYADWEYTNMIYETREDAKAAERPAVRDAAAPGNCRMPRTLVVPFEDLKYLPDVSELEEQYWRHQAQYWRHQAKTLRSEIASQKAKTEALEAAARWKTKELLEAAQNVLDTFTQGLWKPEPHVNALDRLQRAIDTLTEEE